MSLKEATDDKRKECCRRSGEREAVAGLRHSRVGREDSCWPPTRPRDAYVADGGFQLSPSLAGHQPAHED